MIEQWVLELALQDPRFLGFAIMAPYLLLLVIVFIIFLISLIK